LAPFILDRRIYLMKWIAIAGILLASAYAEWGTIPDPNEQWLLNLNKEKLPQLSAEEYKSCLKWWGRRGGTDEIWRVCGLPPSQPLGPN
jgi:hypothetical protein